MIKLSKNIFFTEKILKDFYLSIRRISQILIRINRFIKKIYTRRKSIKYNSLLKNFFINIIIFFSRIDIKFTKRFFFKKLTFTSRILAILLRKISSYFKNLYLKKIIINDNKYVYAVFKSKKFNNFNSKNLRLSLNQRISECENLLIYKILSLETISMSKFILCEKEQNNSFENLLKSFEICIYLENKYKKNLLKINTELLSKSFLENDLMVINILYYILFNEKWKWQINPDFLSGTSLLKNALDFLDLIICNFDFNLDDDSDPLVLEKVGLAHKVHIMLKPSGISYFHLLRSIEILSILNKKSINRDVLRIQLAELNQWVHNDFIAIKLLENNNYQLNDIQNHKRNILLARQYIRMGFFDRAISVSKHIWFQNVPALESKGDFEESLKIYRKSFLSLDRKDYEDIPQWSYSKVNLSKECVLLTQWAKGGGADEILFAEVILNLKSLGKNLYIETEPRCYELMKNSFPDNVVFNVGSKPPWEVDQNLIKPTIQLHTRCYAFDLYRSMKDFPRPKKYLKADPKSQKKWRDIIEKISKKKLKVGFNWRSYWNVGEGAYCQLSIRDLKLMFSEIKNDISLFNLQYDITEQEKEYIAKNIGLNVYYPEIDQMNDFNNLAALISKLDVVICPPTTPYAFAGAVGTKIIFLRPSGTEDFSYISLGWFKDEVKLIKEHRASWDTILPITFDKLRY